MQLPGGLALATGELARVIVWKPLNGKLELELSQALSAGHSVPDIMLHAAGCAIRSIGSVNVDLDQLDKLSVVDMRVILAALAGRFGLSLQWITHRCESCDEPFDFSVDLADLPITDAGETYPETTLQISGKTIRVSVPTIADQRAAAAASEESEVAEELFWRCVCDEQGALKGRRASAKVLAKIEEALSKMAPAVPFSAEAKCPNCDATNLVPINVVQWLWSLADSPIDDVHTIASTYGWSEADILALARSRRKSYIARINKDGGGSVQEILQ